MKGNTEAKKKFFEKGIFAPFHVLKVEKFYLFWIFSFIVSFSSIILDICNGAIASSISQGIFFSTCMAILAPLFFEFLVEYLSLHRKGKKEEYSTYKAWTMAFCLLVLLILFFFYVTKVKSSLLAQVVVSIIVFVLSFYTYLVSKMGDHDRLLEKYKDKSYIDAENDELKRISEGSKNPQPIKNEQGEVMKL